MKQQSTGLSKEELKNRIEVFADKYDKTQVDIMFVRKTSSKQRTYKTYMMECSKQSVKEMIIGSLENISRVLDTYAMEPYDLEMSRDDTVQYVQKESVIHSDAILGSLTEQLDDQNTLNQDVDFDKLNFVVIQLYMPQEDKRLLLFKNHVRKTAAMKTKAVMFSFNGKEFKPLTDKILTIGSNVEAFLTDDYYYILNRNKFNSMFDYKDAFLKVIEDNQSAIVNMDMITSAQDFIDLCKSDGRYMPRLTKAILGKGFGNLATHKAKLGKIKADYGLQVELTGDGKIVYNKPEDAAEILNLLLDHYVISALTENKMLAKAIEKYEIR